ncbi:MAG: PEP-CTERM sorting domain-containing protein [Candidatus Korobacteraceae bacterium]
MKKALLFVLVSLVLVTVANASTSKAIFAFTYPPFQTGDVELQTNTGNTVSTMTGWYDIGGNHDATNPDYIVGLCGSSDSCNGGNDVFNNFFTFNVPAGTYTSATISAFLPNPGSGLSAFYCNCTSLTYQLWDVSTPISQLMASNSGRVDIFNDLDSGIFYGSAVVTSADQGTQILITLDAAGLASLNASAGGTWAVGGSIYGAQSPEPGTLLMFGSGALGLAGLLRRKINL